MVQTFSSFMKLWDSKAFKSIKSSSPDYLVTDWVTPKSYSLQHSAHSCTLFHVNQTTLDRIQGHQGSTQV